MCYTRRNSEDGVGALRESDETNFLKPNGQSRNLNIYDLAQGIQSWFFTGIIPKLIGMQALELFFIFQYGTCLLCFTDLITCDHVILPPFYACYLFCYLFLGWFGGQLCG